MITKKLLAAIGIVSLLAVPAMAQTTDKEKNGHHYSGGPKTEVPHHMGKKETVGVSKDGASGGRRRTTWATKSNKDRARSRGGNTAAAGFSVSAGRLRRPAVSRPPDLRRIDDTSIGITGSRDLLEKAVLASRNEAGFADEYWATAPSRTKPRTPTQLKLLVILQALAAQRCSPPISALSTPHNSARHGGFGMLVS
ncbi:hypothetical protein ACVIWV_000030 [Bradyrhizobium diazoefficiens]|nr:hypothetical protein [Bradyrhizobium diazoefficiens]